MSTVAVANDSARPDVLTITLFVAAALHLIVILGVSFEPFLDDMRTPPALEVILVPKNDSSKPEEADYLAQSSQDGGGSSDDNARPASPFASQQDFDTDGLAPTPVVASAPTPTEAGADAVLTNIFSEDEINAEVNDQPEVVPDAQQDVILVEQNLDIARLSAEIDRQQEEFAKRPKKTYLTARTHEAASAEYMYRWVEKVERIGNLNYPTAASERGLTGALVLVVGIYKNGELESVTVDESSGFPALDEAARDIVKLAGPFEPLSGQLAEETDILYIVRTWEFQSSDSVISY